MRREQIRWPPARAGRHSGHPIWLAGPIGAHIMHYATLLLAPESGGPSVRVANELVRADGPNWAARIQLSAGPMVGARALQSIQLHLREKPQLPAHQIDKSLAGSRLSNGVCLENWLALFSLFIFMLYNSRPPIPAAHLIVAPPRRRRLFILLAATALFMTQQWAGRRLVLIIIIIWACFCKI